MIATVEWPSISDTTFEEVRVINTLPDPEVARAIRERAGVTRRRLAKELGVHELTVLRWESGTSHPRGRALTKYAKLLVALQKVCV